MRTAIASMVLFALVSVLLLWASGCGENKAEGKVRVAVSIVPLADFCRNVGGDLVEVEVIVPPGASPHTFEPTAGQMKFLSDASVFVYNGLDLETWLTDTVKKVGNKELVEVAAADNIPGPELIEAGGDHGIYDPHVWLDPNLAIYQVEAIRDGLVKADPDNEESYRENARRYIEELKALDEYIKGKTSTFTRKNFVSFHPAFTYFARRYGLEQVGVIEKLPGKEPSAGEIANIIDVIREQGVQVIFTEPQFNPQAAETIAAESGAEVVLKSLDPLGGAENPDASTYVKLIKRNTGVMAEAMK